MCDLRAGLVADLSKVEPNPKDRFQSGFVMVGRVPKLLEPRTALKSNRPESCNENTQGIKEIEVIARP